MDRLHRSAALYYHDCLTVFSDSEAWSHHHCALLKPRTLQNLEDCQHPEHH
jgi:hypothetical protein